MTHSSGIAHKQYTLETGSVVEWIFSPETWNYQLEFVKFVKRSDDAQCDNPFNSMTQGELRLICHEKPAKPPTPCGVNNKIYRELITTREELEKSIKDTIDSDCWGLYYISPDQKTTNEIFSHRNKPSCGWKNCSICDKRHELLNSPNEVVKHVDAGETAVCVMGGSNFIEIYYYALQTGYQKISNWVINRQ